MRRSQNHPNDPAVAGPLLERARVLILAGRPLLDIDDARTRTQLSAASMRARIELAEIFVGRKPSRERAKLGVDGLLRRGEDKLATADSGGGHVSNETFGKLLDVVYPRIPDC